VSKKRAMLRELWLAHALPSEPAPGEATAVPAR